MGPPHRVHRPAVGRLRGWRRLHERPVEYRWRCCPAGRPVSQPSVSIIVLNWNGRPYLAECLGSLRSQTYDGPYQVVLVDNGSQDGSADYVEASFPGVRLIRSAVNLGFAAGNNLAARQLDTDLLAFLNNDTRTEPTWLDELVQSVTVAPDVACAGGRILSWDGKTVDFLGGGATLTGLGIQFGYGQPAAVEAPAGDILFACGGSMIVKREPYLQIGGLDDDYFLFYEDLDLGWRFWLAGYRVRYAPGAIMYHRHHGGTRRFEDERLAVLYERNALYTIYKNYDDRHLAAVLPAALLLTAERATQMAGIDRRGFQLPAGSNRLAQPALTSGVVKVDDWTKVTAGLRQHGVGATGRRLLRAVRMRLRPAIGRLRGRLGERISGRRSTVLVPRVAISRLVALEEFGTNLPELIKKRRAVQALRRRDDDDIIELFKTALEPGFDGPGFIEFHRALVQALRLDRLVEVRPSSERPASHA
ncbi:MAG: glycosyltransferase family 2 protein [Chloroflexi bacterium]|nr:MAG: glycosyltransferase family 2 protein [Chloroflexota bacterium]